MLGINSLGTITNDFLGAFGAKGGAVGFAIDTLTGNSLGQLQNLQDMFAETALGRATGPIQRRLLGMGMRLPASFIPAPMAIMPLMRPICGCGYAGSQKIDLAPGALNIPGLSALLDPRRRAAGRFERMLRHNPMARAAFEAQMGGRIVDFGFRNDGKMRIQRFSPGCHPMGMAAMNPLAGAAMAHFGALSTAALSMGGLLGLGAKLIGRNPFMGFMAGALGGVLGMGASSMGMLGMGAMGMGAMGGVSGPGWGFTDNSGPLGGRGFGSWNPLAMPGRINNTNPMYESAHQAQVSGILNDPSLTVEDRVTLMIMLIMNKMDKDIQNQAEYINSIQQQQSNKGKSGKGGKGGKGGGIMGIGGKGKGGGGGAKNDAPSIDVETMKLKRMIDKRGQMFDMLRQIIDKYNQTAKGIIDSIGR